jgi:hypothetical protein
VADKGFSGEAFEELLAGPDLGLTLVRPARKDDKKPRYFPNWLRQRVEAVIWTLKNQLGLERHGGRVPAGLWARIVQRLLADSLRVQIVKSRHSCVAAAPDEIDGSSLRNRCRAHRSMASSACRRGRAGWRRRCKAARSNYFRD